MFVKFKSNLAVFNTVGCTELLHKICTRVPICKCLDRTSYAGEGGGGECFVNFPSNVR